MNLEELRENALIQKRADDNLTREKGLSSLYLFNKYILKAEEGENKVPLASFHREMCNFVQDSTDKKKLLLVPRLHLKSTLVTVGYSVWNILKNPNIRILILSATYENAADFVGAIKDHLSRNETLIRLYGNVAKNPIEWSNNRITLRTNRTAVGDKEPTVLGAGIETNVVSKHFDLVILDDVVVRENTETIEQIDKVVRRYRDTINLMDTKAQLIVIGTRWVDNDLYSWLLDPENEQRPQYLTFIKRALDWEGDLSTALREGTGFLRSLWEAKFTRDVLLQKYISSGPYEFSTQYLNDPVPDTEATFNKGWFKYYEETDIRGDFINNYLTIDPAISTDKEADYTAMIVTGVDRWNNIYVRDIIRQHFTPNEIINMIFKLSELWHPKQIGLEEVAWQKTLSYSMRDEMRKRGRSLPIIPVKPGARSKDERIRGLQPLYANGKVFHNRNHPGLRYLEDELMRFPRAKHDDLCLTGDTLIKTERGDIPIKDVKVGDKVLTRSGYKKVMKSEMTGFKNVITKLGITATPDHPFITKEGIKPLTNLRASDIIHVWNEKQLSIEERSITDILNQKEDNLEFISTDILNGRLLLSFSIVKFGLTTLGKYLRDILYIIKTKTHLTMSSLTLHVFPLQNILAITPHDFYGQKQQEEDWEKLEKLQPDGINQMWEENGIRNTQKECGTLLSVSRSLVSNAGINLRPLSRILNFVKNSIVGLNTGKFKKVYNLQVEGSHEYFANNILVHNCDALSYTLDFFTAPRSRRASYQNKFLY